MHYQHIMSNQCTVPYPIYQFGGRCSIIIRHHYYTIFYISELSVLDEYQHSYWPTNLQKQLTHLFIPSISPTIHPSIHSFNKYLLSAQEHCRRYENVLSMVYVVKEFTIQQGRWHMDTNY